MCLSRGGGGCVSDCVCLSGDAFLQSMPHQG